MIFRATSRVELACARALDDAHTAAADFIQDVKVADPRRRREVGAAGVGRRLESQAVKAWPASAGRRGCLAARRRKNDG